MEEKKSQWTIIEQNSVFIRCVGVYNDVYVALGKLIEKMQCDIAKRGNDGYIVSDISLGEPLEADTGCLYSFKASSKHGKYDGNYYLLEVQQEDDNE